MGDRYVPLLEQKLNAWDRELWEFVTDTFLCDRPFTTSEVVNALRKAGQRVVHSKVRVSLSKLERGTKDLQKIPRPGSPYVMWILPTNLEQEEEAA